MTRSWIAALALLAGCPHSDDPPGVDAPGLTDDGGFVIDAPIDAPPIDGPTNRNEGFVTPAAVTKANVFQGGSWTEVGNADWSCLNAPSADEPSTGTIMLNGTIDDFQTGNGVSGAKLSEHARGNAIDISAFKIEGRGWIEVGGIHFGAEQRFLKAIRASACGPFTTVLGPGSDAYHSDHFHLDLAERNKRGKSRGLYCK